MHPDRYKQQGLSSCTPANLVSQLGGTVLQGDALLVSDTDRTQLSVYCSQPRASTACSIAQNIFSDFFQHGLTRKSSELGDALNSALDKYSLEASPPE
jgi:hypothetical protein